ncbi:hypothetical protein D3C87_1598080 [compost metagenome]
MIIESKESADDSFCSTAEDFYDFSTESFSASFGSNSDCDFVVRHNPVHRLARDVNVRMIFVVRDKKSETVGVSFYCAV